MLGLTPEQRSTGGKTRLCGITKRGDVYLRTLLVQGAHSVLYRVDGKTDPRSIWMQRLLERRGRKIAALAVANKNARIAWAVLRRRRPYREDAYTS